MVFSNPTLDFHPEPLCKLVHFVCFEVGDSTGSLVIRNVPFLSKGIELLNGCCVQAKGHQRFDHSVVVVRPFRLEASRNQRCRCELQGGIVRNIEPPVVVKAGGLGSRQVPIGYGEQAGDFLPACFVLLEPPEFAPIL